MPREPETAASSLEQALQWQKAYVDLLRVDDAVLGELKRSAPALSAELRLEVQEVTVAALVERMRQLRRRRIRWDARVLGLSPSRAPL